MANVLIEENTLLSIAEQVRSALGTSEKMLMSEVPSKIGEIQAKIPPNGMVWTQSNIQEPISGICYSDKQYVGWVAFTSDDKGGFIYHLDGNDVSTFDHSWIDKHIIKAIHVNSLFIGWSVTNGILYCKTTIYPGVGHNWTQSNITSGIYDVCYGNGIYVAIGSTGVLYSTDGKTWTQSDSITNDRYTKVVYGNGLFMICDSTQSGIYYSTDGMTWTVNQNYRTLHPECIKYLESFGAWFINSSRGYVISENGLDVTTTNNTATYRFEDVYFSNGLLVACNSKGLWYSLYPITNGQSWSQSNIVDISFNKVTYANGMWVACSVDNGLYYSTDGKTWTQSNITSGTFNEVYNANGVWVICGDTGVYYSKSIV